MYLTFQEIWAPQKNKKHRLWRFHEVRFFFDFGKWAKFSKIGMEKAREWPKNDPEMALKSPFN